MNCSLRKMLLLLWVFSSITPVAHAMEEDPLLSDYNADSFWDPEDGRFRFAPEIPVIARAANLIDPFNFKQILRFHLKKKTSMTAAQLGEVSKNILKENAIYIATKWGPFFGVNFLCSCAIGQIHYPLHWLAASLQNIQYLADILIILNHYACTYGAHSGDYTVES